MSFGWSAGDIVAAVNFIITITKALDEVSGASQQFRDARDYLVELNTELQEISNLLRANPAFGEQVEDHINTIKISISDFINAPAVQKLNEHLDVRHEGHFNSLSNMGSKLKWHFQTAEKAADLEKRIARRMKLIGSVMQRYTISSVVEQKGAVGVVVGETIEAKFNTHLPKLQDELMLKLYSRDEMNKKRSQAELREVLREFWGQHRLTSPPLSRSSTLVDSWDDETRPQLLTDGGQVTQNVESMRKLMEILKQTCSGQLSLVEACRYRGGLRGDPRAITAIRTWWQNAESSILCVKDAPRDRGDPNIAQQLVAVARDSKVRLAAYFCAKLDTNGVPYNQQEHFIELLYSLLYQLWTSLDDKEISEILTNSVDRLSELDGTVDSIDSALELFEELVSSEGHPVLIVIDKVETLSCNDDDVLESTYRNFFHKLEHDRKDAILKVFLRMERKSVLAAQAARLGTMVDTSLSNNLGGWYSSQEFHDDTPS